MSILEKVVRTKEWSLLCTYEEEDSRIFSHILSLENRSNVVIRTADTDCLIMGLGYRKKLNLSSENMAGSRVQNRSNLQFISVDSIYSYLNKNLYKTLLAFDVYGT